MRCAKCSGTSIKTRKNFSHGNKSKATINRTCNKCGSMSIEAEDPRRRKFRR